MPLLFWWLLLGHLIGDFPLQTEGIFRVKTDRRWGVVLHGSICGVIGFGVALPYLQYPQAWLYLGILWGFHILMDRAKLSLIAKFERGSIFLFLVDQALHLGSFWLVGLALRGVTPLWEGFYLSRRVIQYVQVLSAYVAATYGAMFVISLVWDSLGFQANQPSLGQIALQFAERVTITTFIAMSGVWGFCYLLVPVSLLPRSLCFFRKGEARRFLDLGLSLILGILVGVALKPVFVGR